MENKISKWESVIRKCLMTSVCSIIGIYASASALAQDYYHAVILTPHGMYAQLDDPAIGVGVRSLGTSAGLQAGHLGFYDQSNNFQLQAALWIDAGQPPTILHPQGFTNSVATGGLGNMQVGYGLHSEDYFHALLWYGSASSVVDLHPTNFVSSYAFDVKGNKQVGRGHRDIGTKFRALMWQGISQSVVDLHPDDLFYHTEAHGINETGSTQVGFGMGEATDFEYHALMWSGTAASYVDLHYSNWLMSLAQDTSGDSIVGEAWVEPNTVRGHAILWEDCGATIVDLHPDHTNFNVASWANAVYENTQVGGAVDENGTVHAFLWHGIQQSAVD